MIKSAITGNLREFLGNHISQVSIFPMHSPKTGSSFFWSIFIFDKFKLFLKFQKQFPKLSYKYRSFDYVETNFQEVIVVKLVINASQGHGFNTPQRQ